MIPRTAYATSMTRWILSFAFAALAIFPFLSHAASMDAIDFVKKEGIMTGYPDGSFRPKHVLNRAEFVKVLVESTHGEHPPVPATLCFPDIKKSDWFAGYVCFAKEQGLVSGYSDGKFYPAREVNLAEASKMIAIAFKLSLTTTPKDAPWYESYLKAATATFSIPDTFTHIGQLVQREQIAEILYRIVGKATGRPHVSYDALKVGACVPLGEDLPANVDMKKVRDTWLGWYNTARAANGLAPYIYNIQLHRTAIAWSEISEKRNSMTHKRDDQTAYYDYARILQWFKDLGVTFKSVNTVTFTENIGWSPYSCTKSDCTEDVIKAIRYTFDFYMAEKNMAYRPHYNSLMNKYFKEIGVGIAIDEVKKKLYITIHYAVEPIGALPVCAV